MRMTEGHFGCTDRCTARQRPSERSSNSSEAMVRFLKERAESNQGISLQKLPGHLSQPPPCLRSKHGCPIKSLKMFLRQFLEVIAIRDDGNVFLSTERLEAANSLDGDSESFKSFNPTRGTDGEDVASMTSLPSSSVLHVGESVIFDAKGERPKGCES
ncbi:hypothetical protein HPB48_006234 [Haemaphysalis longicornis]|uniref:Uncharacterized protein n=1 Tax=Haemaphysalis longicornis TaxID=44386 RepID=A0A9J6GRZ8_HAELO|nr:hypothetical protein HPB48_006234 [Haemaphysalis longicornis]